MEVQQQWGCQKLTSAVCFVASVTYSSSPTGAHYASAHRAQENPYHHWDPSDRRHPPSKADGGHTIECHNCSGADGVVQEVVSGLLDLQAELHHLVEKLQGQGSGDLVSSSVT